MFPQDTEYSGQKVQALTVSRAGSLYNKWPRQEDTAVSNVLSEICRPGLAGHYQYPSRDSEILHEGDTLLTQALALLN